MRKKEIGDLSFKTLRIYFYNMMGTRQRNHVFPIDIEPYYQTYYERIQKQKQEADSRPRIKDEVNRLNQFKNYGKQEATHRLVKYGE